MVTDACDTRCKTTRIDQGSYLPVPRTDIAPAPQRPAPTLWASDRLTLSWLGHATVLLNFYGSWLLTDPALERRIGIGRGLAKLGPRRLVEPALKPDELPRLDVLLLSHAHMDHTDLGTLRLLPRDIPVVVQPGNQDLDRRFRTVHQIAWGQVTEVRGLRVVVENSGRWADAPPLGRRSG